MGLARAALRLWVVVTVTLVVVARHEPPVGAPQFRRDSVEAVPPSMMRLALEDEPYGNRALPLRTAVEKVPEHEKEDVSTVRTSFLRDAVEHRPPVASGPWGFVDEWSHSSGEGLGRYESLSSGDDLPPRGHNAHPETHVKDFSVDSQPLDWLRPPPYRAGSQYQQLLDFSSYSNASGALKGWQHPRAPPSVDKYKVLCYVTNWSFYRKAEGKFVPENLDPSLCSHIIYAFVSLDPETLTIREFDPWADIDNGLYQRITSMDGPPVLLGLGGWTDSTGDKYSRLVSDGGLRRNFVTSTVSFLRRHNFRGLHIDWNYPKCWQSDCKKGPASDKPNFTKLIQELKQEFVRPMPNLLLGAAISGYKEVITESYELQPLCDVLDFVTLMTYDYHGSWEPRTGHVSPLHARADDKYPQYNADFTVEYLVKHGAVREKLLLGVPFYGQSFTLARGTATAVGEGARSDGPGEAGEFTRQPGMLAYYEICHRVRNQHWSVGRVDGSPHASSQDQWVGYEDPISVMAKADYVVQNGLAGVVAWTADLDDFTNRCCQEAFPLLKALNRALGRLPGSPPSPGDCTKPDPPVTPPAPVLTTAVDSGAVVTTPMHEHVTPSTWPSWSTTKRPTKKPFSTTPASSTSPWWTTTERTTTERTSTTEKTTAITWWSTTSSTTMRPTTSPTSEGTTIPAPAVIMPVLDSEGGTTCTPGEYRPDPANCNAYYRCVLGEMRQQFCVGGLHFNKRTAGCDWPASAKCTIVMQSVTVDDDVTTAATTYTTSSRIPVTRPPSTTTTARYTTTTRRPIVTTRPASTTERSTTTRGTTARPTNRPTKQPVQSTPMPCNTGQYYPHEQCDMFSICVNGHLLSQSCAPGLQWSAESGMCDWAKRVRCDSSGASPERQHRQQLQQLQAIRERQAKMFGKHLKRLQNSPSLLWTRGLPDGPCEGDDRYPYPGDCSQYLLCQWGHLTPASCAPGLHWNQKSRICDWPVNAQCNVEGVLAIEPDSEEISPPSLLPTTLRPSTTTSTEEPIPSTTAVPLEPLSGHFKVVCYFTNWAWYRRGIGKYLPEHIDPQLCTHVVYGFAVLDYSELTVRAHDSWADFDNKFYARVVALREKGIKVSLALGGWNDSAGDKYSRLVNSAAARARFISHMVAFIEKHEFHGLDLDWEYPVCWQVDCKKGPASDKEGFAALVKELSAEFRPRGWLLSTAVSPSKTVIDAGYDVPTLAEYFDWIAVMTYDFHGQWDKQTGHVAPLYYHPEDEVSFFNANFSLNYWMELGAPARKLVMGMPLYGQSFTLSDPKNNGLNAKAPGPGQAGEFTRAAGFLAYYEICDRVKNRDWTVVKDPEGRMGPYAYKGNQWVSYDDVDTLRRKSELVRALGLGGGMIWALDLDDFRNRCGDGVHPLLTTIREVLKDPPRSNEIIPPLLSPPTTTPTTPKPETESVGRPEAWRPTSETMVEESDPDSGYKVVCYFTNWAWYRQGGGKYIPSDIDPELCTHVVYGFAVLDRDSLTVKPHDSWADIDNKFYSRVVALKKKGVKVSLALGGWNDSAGDKYSRLVNSVESRARFVRHVTTFIEKHEFDGLDLDWEYPVCWQVDCKKGPASDKEGFSALVRELSAEFRPRNWLLTAAVSPSKRVVDAGYDVPALSKYFDWIAVMAYDFHGQWDKKTGHVAPMYEHPTDEDRTFNANYSINYWIESGADRRKLVMGMPLYGQSFSLADNSRNILNSPTYGGGEAGEATRARGFLSYYEICHNIRNRGWHVVRDRRGRMGPYAYLRDQWVSFDDVAMIKHKSEYVRAMDLGGAMVWALDLDDFRNNCDCEEYPLLRAINRVLRGFPGPAPMCRLESETEVSEQESPDEFESPEVESENPEDESKDKTSTTSSPTVSTWWPTKPTVAASPSKPPKPTRPTKPTVILAESPDMACDGRVFSPHLKDCNKYYLCQFGTLQVHSCPGGLHWNKDHCDWPHNSNCVDGVDAEIPLKPSEPQPKPTKRPKPVTKPTKPVLETSTMIIETTSKPIPSSTRPPLEDLVEDHFKVVCYFTNWAWYRQGDGKYTPDDIDPELCTHIVYGFAVLDQDSLTVKAHDSWADFDNKFYERVVALKQKGIKVSLALGGWNDSLGDKYSRLVGNAAARARFIEHVTDFIEEHDFDGLDLDWEYPVCWQVDCKKGPASDKAGFASLVRELSMEFRPRGWLLSSAVSPSKMVIDAGYDVPTLAEYFDWIAVMTYDFHGHWDKQTGHVAPLYYHPGDTYDYFNSNFSLHYWMDQGAPSRKLIMGMPLYGQSFSLADSSERGLNAKSYGPGEAGEFTRAGGFLAFYEICERVRKRGWTVERDALGRVGPYAHQNMQWVSYDDVSEIRRKSRLVKDLDLGGGMIWALDLDDFRGRCGCGKHPLLRTLNQELRGVQGRVHTDCT